MLWGCHECAALALLSSSIWIFQQNKVNLIVLWPLDNKKTQDFYRHIKVSLLAQLKNYLQEGDTNICLLQKEDHANLVILCSFANFKSRKETTYFHLGVSAHILSLLGRNVGETKWTSGAHKLFSFTDSITA